MSLLDSASGPRFPQKLVKQLMSAHWDSRMKVSPEAVDVCGEYFRVFVVEAISRACLEAQRDGLKEVGVEHVERVIASLLLDM